MNANPTFTMAGIWVPINASYLSQNNTGGLANSEYSLIRIGKSSQYGLVITGWGFSGWSAATASPESVSMTLLTQDATGNLSINTSSYISDPVTNGGQSVIVVDFNGDGRQDIFLAAHNESPMVAMPSTAYLSNSSGGFTKVTLGDHVMAHDASLGYANGQPVVLTMTFLPGDVNPIYKYSDGGFVETQTNPSWNVNGMSSVLAGFGKDGALKLVRGDVGSDFNSATGFWNAMNIEVFDFNGTNISSTIPSQVIVPYLSTLPQYKNYSSNWGVGVTHTYRIWTDDLNHDEKPDLLAGESMWNTKFNTASPDFPVALDVLINQGGGQFKEMTAKLNPDMSLNSEETDYSPTFIDLDHSGINSYMFAGLSWAGPARQPNNLLLNDGTGRLYVAVHSQFVQLSTQVYSYLQQQFSGRSDVWIDSSSSDSAAPSFMGIPQADGSVNYVAEVPFSVKDSTNNLWHQEYALVNVPFAYNPRTDFTQNVTVSDRNESKLMRTWAGNDTFYDANGNAAPAHIDGGLGIDTVVYNHNASSYTVTHNTDGSTTVAGNGLTDTLVNIERLQFTDKEVALDLDGSAGTTVKILGAAFGASSISNKKYVGIGLNLLDDGISYSDLMTLALSAAGATTHPAEVTLLWTNIFGAAPSVDEAKPFIDMLDNGVISVGDLGVIAAELELNKTNINLVGLRQTGIEYSQ